jgi:AAA ATPase-like protein
VLDGASRVLVVRGDPGIGKTALLTYLSERVAGWRLTRAVGVESDMQVAFSGFHQWCAPSLGDVEKLPGPQRGAIKTVFGLDTGPVPDPFLVGLATLTLMAQAAEGEPLACIIDDAQWLDELSAQIRAWRPTDLAGGFEPLRSRPAPPRWKKATCGDSSGCRRRPGCSASAPDGISGEPSPTAANHSPAPSAQRFRRSLRP